MAKIVEINSVNVILKVQDEVCQSSGCQNQCKKGLLSFLFPSLNKGHLIVALKKKPSRQHHIIDEEAFFNTKYHKNDIIGLSFSEKHLFKLSLMLYGLPIISMMVFMILCYALFLMLDYPVDIGGVIGLGLGLFFSRQLIKLNNERMKPTVKFFK